MISPMPTTTTETERQGRPCACGCGEITQRKQAAFVRGHDSQLGKRLRQAYRDGEATRAEVLRQAKGISPKFLDHLRHGLDRIDATKKAEKAKARNGKAAKPAKEQEQPQEAAKEE